MMDDDTRQLTEKYWETLQDYLKDMSEASLHRGYELARRALVDGCGVLEMGAIHHEALRRLLAEYRVPNVLLKAANDFFSEALSPFEMSHRGAREGTRALRHLNELLEAESKRIAHALHDEAGQLLATVHIAIADIAKEMPQTRDRLGEVQHLLRKIEAELRNLSHELRPTVLDNLGLLPALEFLAESVAKRTGLDISVEGETNDKRLPAPVETALYRIVQEALNNAAKHAQANRVDIKLQCTPARVACSVRDDGRGFVVPQAGGRGLGLLGIRERLNALGGSLRVVAEPKNGTTLLADIPLRG